MYFMEQVPILSVLSSGYLPVPALPQALLALVKQCRAKKIAESSLVTIIATDPALTIQTFKTAVTICPDTPSAPFDLGTAVSLLGVANIQLMATQLLSFQGGHFDKNYDQSLIDLWRHSHLSANMASRIAAQLSISSPDTAYLAGLLHDIGEFIVKRPSGDIGISEPKPDNRREIHTLENSEKQVNACVTGARYVYTCCGNPYIADAIRYHCEPLERVQAALPLVQVVYLANLLSTEIDSDTPLSYDIAKTLFGLPLEAVDGICIAAKDETAKISRSFGIGSTPSLLKNTVPPRAPGRVAIHAEIGLATIVACVLDQLMHAVKREAVFDILFKAIQIEFGLPRPIFLQYIENKRYLAGQAWLGNGGPGYDPELIIDLDKADGLMVEAFNKNRIRNSLETPSEAKMCLADCQVRHLLGSNEMLCIPVNGRQKTMGLLVIGFNGQHMQFQDNHIETLNKLTDYAGMRLDDLMGPGLAKADVANATISRGLTTRKMIHEVNNPLSIIKNYLGVLKVKLPESHPVQNETGIIEEEIDRIKAILSLYADFTATNDRQERVDVNTLIEDQITFMEASLNPSSALAFNTHLDAMLPMLSSNKGKLKQVLLNLLLNAAEAMPAGGNVLIQTQFIPASDIGNDNFLLNINGKIQIIIKDDGPGIPEDIKVNLFQPFKTSRADNTSGLGLSIVYNLLLELDGTISCSSSKTAGTLFTLTFPVHA